MQTILVAVDFSPVTEALLQAAAQFGCAQRARVTLLHVVQAPATLWSHELAGEAVAAVAAGQEKDVLARLGGLRASLPGIDVESRATTGPVAAEIVRVGKELNAAVIIVGSHGHTALYDLLLGGIARGVLAGATCPVMVIPANADRRDAAADAVAEAATIAFCSAGR